MLHLYVRIVAPTLWHVPVIPWQVSDPWNLGVPLLNLLLALDTRYDHVRYTSLQVRHSSQGTRLAALVHSCREVIAAIQAAKRARFRFQPCRHLIRHLYDALSCPARSRKTLLYCQRRNMTGDLASRVLYLLLHQT